MTVVSCNGEPQCGWDTINLYQQFHTNTMRRAILRHAVQVEFPPGVPRAAGAAV